MSLIFFKKSLTCKVCNCILNEPVELPCKETICRKHLRIITCPRCKLEHNLNPSEFNPVNSVVSNLLKDKAYLSPEEKGLLEKIENSISVFHEAQGKYNSGLENSSFETQCVQNVQIVLDQIKARHEELKAQIDDLYSKLKEDVIKSASSYMEIFKKDLATSYPKNDVDDSKFQDVKKFELDPNISESLLQEMYNQQHCFINTFRSGVEEVTLIRKQILNSIGVTKPENIYMMYSSTNDSINFSRNPLGSLKEVIKLNDPVFNSEILTGRQAFDLVELCKFSLLEDNFSLLYRGSIHGFGAKEFHSKCDGAKKTLTILKANGFVFGGFVSVGWDSSEKYKSDKNSFLFSLTNPNNEPTKTQTRHFEKAIYCDPAFGPVFGPGHDIHIYSKADTHNDSYSNMGCRYINGKRYMECHRKKFGNIDFKNRQITTNTNGAQISKCFYAGTRNFKLEEIEVYQMEVKSAIELSD